MKYQVSDYISIPTKPLSREERKSILLEDELGVKKFVEVLSGDSNKYFTDRIDPMRVTSVNVKNLVWSITGNRPDSLSQASQFISNYRRDNALDKKSILNKIRIINDEKVGHEQKIQQCLGILEEIIEYTSNSKGD